MSSIARVLGTLTTIQEGQAIAREADKPWYHRSHRQMSTNGYTTMSSTGRSAFCLAVPSVIS